MRINIIICLLAITIFLGTAETVLQLFWKNPYNGTSTDVVIKLGLLHKNMNQQLNRKLIDSKVSEVLYRTNNAHYMEPSYRFANPDFSVVFMGGSTTECMAVQEDMRFPYLVSKILETKGLRINSLNVARSGGTLHDSLNVLLNHVSNDYPNAIVLMHVANDIGVLSKDKSYTSRMGHEISLKDIIKYIMQILSTKSTIIGYIRQITDVGVFKPNDVSKLSTPKQCDVDPRPYVERLRVFIEMSRSFNIIPILVTEPLAINNISNSMTPGWINNTCQSVFNQSIRDVSNALNADMIDLASYVEIEQAKPNETEKIFYDGMHVTDYGSTIYANYIAKSLYAILNKPKSMQPTGRTGG